MNGEHTDLISQHRNDLLDVYKKMPSFIREHHGIEQKALAGCYGYRQVMELVQNGADSILEALDDGLAIEHGNRIHVILRGSRLYVANTGAPLSADGLRALLSSHSSPKRGNQIGRFGLGFKSLLRLGGSIDLFTRSFGGVRFNPERCRQEVRTAASEAGLTVTDAPGLRLAWPLTDTDRDGDEVLSKLDWAETIVRAEISNSQILTHIREEICTFPAEFLLFLSASVVLTLDDGSSPERGLSVRADGQWCELNVGANTARWRLASTEVEVTDEQATGDATAIHARKKVPLTWAVPVDGKREEAGRFWAFFPTESATHVPGILNAPWKVNDARTSIERGEWNAALMRKAALLIAETLPKLASSDDPGCVLDAFPRQLERKDEIAAPLVAELWSHLRGATIIPDATGTLRLARDLWVHPRDKADLARQWQSLSGPNELSRLVHPSCLERQRNSRLTYLSGELKPATGEAMHPNLRKHEAAAWFDATASVETPKAIEVLKLAEAYKATCTEGEWHPIRPLLVIIPSQGGELLTAGRVVFAPVGVTVPEGQSQVAQSVCEDSEAKRILVEVMKVRTLDDGVWRDVLASSLNVPQFPEAARAAGWLSFWTRLRSAPDSVKQEFVMQNKSRIRIRRQDGQWVLSNAALLPGGLVSADDVSANRNLLVDLVAHHNDASLLATLGVCDFPDGVIGPGNYEDVTQGHDGLSEWLSRWRTHYQHHVNAAATWGSLKPRGLTLPAAWMFAPSLTGVPSARLTARILSAIARGQFTEQLKFNHSTVANYPTIPVPHPLPWFVFKHGSLQVGERTVRLPAFVAKSSEPSLARLSNWNELLPALEKLASTEPASTPTPEEIRNLWAALTGLLVTPPALADDSLRDLWTGAAKDKFVPEALGDISLAKVFVTGSADLARRARRPERIVVTLGEDALKLWLEAGAQDLSTLMTVEKSESGPADLLVSVLPELAALDADESAPLILRPEIVSHSRCQPVTGLKLNIGDAPEPAPCLMWQGTLLVDAEQLVPLSRAKRLKSLLNEVAASGWLNCDPAEALRRLGDVQVEEQRAKVRNGTSLPERLLIAVGRQEQPLRSALGELATRDFIQQCTALQLAELTLAQLGPSTLSALKVTMASEGLQPPTRWNTAEARAFVASIGFPEEFAASPESRREAEEFISGPIALPPLHDFQVELFEGIRQVIDAGTGRRRGVVSLPTGGGKTRVCVEAAVLLVLAEGSMNRSVIWVAQTDELCEQAVQAFRQVWLNLGTQRTDLRIVRLWGGNPNPAGQESDKPLVVVASIQTLNSRMGRDGLDSLKSPGLVVVDECHHAITPSYTNLLGWLDAMPPRGEHTKKPEPPIFGLSATPFRSDDEESIRLARRFDNRLLPENQRQLKQRLLQQGVLAQVDSEALESNADLLDDEFGQLAALFPERDGIDFDNLLERINQRLGADAQRNERLVERVLQAEERSILFFANSVQHAVEMSARLNLAGITAAAISGETPTAARRFFLDRFQSGGVRVLCNHSVLTTGFDAPKTDMVLISRQVFSPVRYMQMVGRGLRGLANGGTERCRIVTVLDNLRQFGGEHPYHQYWQGYLAEMSGFFTNNI